MPVNMINCDCYDEVGKTSMWLTSNEIGEKKDTHKLVTTILVEIHDNYAI